VLQEQLATMLAAPLGGLTDGLVRKLNDAAGAAAREAKPIFRSAISRLSLADVPNIASQRDGATQYLRSSAGPDLGLKLRPLVDKGLTNVGALRSLDALVAKGPLLRTAGLSRAKALYVRDLAQHIVDGSVVFDSLDSMTNEQIVTELTTVKGIGEWTVHMFLMFCMGRMDVLPHGDLGIRNGVQKLYGLGHTPTPEDVKTVAETYQWHPYESVAAWYIWRSLDNEPVVKD